MPFGAAVGVGGWALVNSRQGVVGWGVCDGCSGLGVGEGLELGVGGSGWEVTSVKLDFQCSTRSSYNIRVGRLV